ncbi:sugar ABC transporter permease [Cohnella kolymensis]|uniref:Sugar ABC transporter permease n=1 Tax=Cohnella kolymensis TaxID=1590652 RepID=A0ABR5A1Y9_9BACL|nr:carbohydrate ABC transporter permease [Cohnella kolymensis]KIL35069.1 sugar ABC transporter permease [Cohnella kolymensis]
MRRRSSRAGSKTVVNVVLAVICLIWLIPTVGLFVSSFRPATEILKTGWWTVLPHKENVAKDQIQLPKDTDLRQPIEVNGQTFSDDQLREGVKSADGTTFMWQNRRARTIDVLEPGWIMNTEFTAENYKGVLTGKTYEIKDTDGTVKTKKGNGMSQAFINTLVVSIPATIIPILIATFAAYAFAWLRFPLRKTMFVIVIMLLVVPLQIAMIPILRDYTALGLNGTFLGIWLAHAGFGLPLATYFMYSYISQLPRDLFESAFMDGASNFTIFTRLILPLSVPSIASISIFQFLWVWNDYLVALIFIGNQPDVQVLSMKIADMVGTRGNDWHLLTAAAFVSMLMPLAVFFGLQKYFVRGLLGGSVKG